MPYTDEFKKLIKSTRKSYLGKDVNPKYRKKCGKKYDKKEVKSIAYAIAKVRGIKTD